MKRTFITGMILAMTFETFAFATENQSHESQRSSPTDEDHSPFYDESDQTENGALIAILAMRASRRRERERARMRAGYYPSYSHGYGCYRHYHGRYACNRCCR